MDWVQGQLSRDLSSSLYCLNDKTEEKARIMASIQRTITMCYGHNGMFSVFVLLQSFSSVFYSSTIRFSSSDHFLFKLCFPDERKFCSPRCLRNSSWGIISETYFDHDQISFYIPVEKNQNVRKSKKSKITIGSG